MLFVAVPYSATPGTTLQERRNWLAQTNQTQLQEWENIKGGCFIRAQEGSMFALPPAMLTLQCCVRDEDAQGVRWGTMQDTSEAPACASILKVAQDAHVLKH